MEIKQINENPKSSFKAFEGEEEAGILVYTWTGEDQISIDHTEVAPEFEGIS